MLKRMAVLAAAVSWTVASMASAQKVAADPVGAAQLAEKFGSMATQVLQSQQIGEDNFRAAYALLEMAARLNPGEERFPRLMLEAATQLKDRDESIVSLNKLRLIDPKDTVVQAQLIDLYAEGTETADARMKYLQQVVDTNSVPAEVRSYAGYRLARVMIDRGQQSEIGPTLDQSLSLNPLNGDVLQLKYENLASDATDAERTKILLAMARANPCQPAVLSTIAGQLADSGLSDVGLTWYAASFNVSNRLGSGLDISAYIDSVALMLIANQPKNADSALLPILQQNGTNVDALLLRMICLKRLDDKDTLETTIAQAEAAILERVYAVEREATGKDPAATQPTGAIRVRLGDLSAVAAQIKQGNRGELVSDLTSSLNDLAFVELYFRQSVDAAAPAIEAIKLLAPEDSPAVARLEGWSLMIAGKAEEAKVKLGAVAEQDPLSKMGLILIASKDPAGKEQAATQASDLAGANMSGFIGAVVNDGLRDLGLKFTPTAAQTAVQAEFNQFPKNWLDVIDRPSNFYEIVAQPLKVDHAFGEAVVASVTIKNSAKDLDLAVGPRGTIRQDLWFDGQAGLQRQSVPGFAYDRLQKTMVLKPGQSVTQKVRLDVGAVQQAFLGNPVVSVPLYVSVFTNPTTSQMGVIPGPAGQRQQFRNPMNRVASPLQQARVQTGIQRALDGRPDEKFQAIDLLTTFIPEMRGARGTEASKAAADQFLTALDRQRVDESPFVSSWVSANVAMLSGGRKQSELIDRMAQSDDPAARMLALIRLRNILPERRATMVEKMKTDADPSVAMLAKALDPIDKSTAAAAATQPTTAPAN